MPLIAATMITRAKTIVIVLAVLAAAVFLFLKFGSSAQINNSGNEEPRQTFYEAINGNVMAEKSWENRPLAVMVENHPDARPQSGLSLADIVYETLAEGGITRFLAIYQSRDAGQIGPVRSAREYFAQIADEWARLRAWAAATKLLRR